MLRISPPREDAGAGCQPLLVFSDGERTMGIAVDDRLDIEVSANDSGKVDSAVVKARATEILDVGYYITQVFDSGWRHRVAAAICCWWMIRRSSVTC